MLAVAILFATVACVLGLFNLLAVYMAAMSPGPWVLNSASAMTWIVTLITAVMCGYTAFLSLDGRPVARWAIVSIVMIVTMIVVVARITPRWFRLF
jgi:hypothetical protein